MDKPQNRDKVFKALQDALGRDKAKTNVLKISELGLVEMTRKRVRESVTRVMNEPCGYCDGRGHLRSKVTVAYEIFREIRRDAPHFPEPVLVVNCHPDVARILQGAERDELRYLMDRFNKTIQVKPQGGYHQEQFDIYGRQDRGERAERDDRRGRGPQRGGRSQQSQQAPAPSPEGAASVAPAPTKEG
jgi:ribonuclease G